MHEYECLVISYYEPLIFGRCVLTPAATSIDFSGLFVFIITLLDPYSSRTIPSLWFDGWHDSAWYISFSLFLDPIEEFRIRQHSWILLEVDKN
jgi:hypothetical protein